MLAGGGRVALREARVGGCRSGPAGASSRRRKSRGSQRTKTTDALLARIMAEAPRSGGSEVVAEAPKSGIMAEEPKPNRKRKTKVGKTEKNRQELSRTIKTV